LLPSANIIGQRFAIHQLDQPEPDFAFIQIRVTTPNGSERHPTELTGSAHRHAKAFVRCHAAQAVQLDGKT
jgi:hypothetical protein